MKLLHIFIVPFLLFGTQVFAQKTGRITALGDRTTISGIPEGEDFVKVTSSKFGINCHLALRSNGTVVGWGEGEYNLFVPPLLSKVKDIAVGQNISAVLDSTGRATVWGPSIITGEIYNVSSITIYDNYLFALKNNGTVSIINTSSSSYGEDSISTSNIKFKEITSGWDFVVGKDSSNQLHYFGYDYNIDTSNMITSGFFLGGRNFIVFHDTEIHSNKIDVRVGSEHGDESLTSFTASYLHGIKKIKTGHSMIQLITNDNQIYTYGELPLGNGQYYNQANDPIIQKNQVANIIDYSIGETSIVSIVYIVPPQFSITNHNLTCNDRSFFQDFSLTDAFSDNVIGIDFEINYDSSIFELISFQMGDALEDYGHGRTTFLEPGKAKVSLTLKGAPSGVSINPSSVLGTLKWNVDKQAKKNAYTISIDNITLSYPISTELSKEKVISEITFDPAGEYTARLFAPDGSIMKNNELYNPTIIKESANCGNILHTSTQDDNGIITISSPATQYLQIERDIKGDITVPNEDCSPVTGEINTADINLVYDIINEVITPSPLQLYAADVNMDGVISAGDATLISTRSLNLNTCEFPQPSGYNFDGTPSNTYVPSKDWLFISEEDVSRSISKTLIPTIFPCQLYQRDICNGNANKFYGVLLGDVDHSWRVWDGQKGLRTVTESNIVFDYSLADTLENGSLSIPIYHNTENFVYGIDLQITLDQVPFQIDSVITLEPSVNYNLNANYLLLQDYNPEGIIPYEPIANVVVSDVITHASLTGIEAYINGQANRSTNTLGTEEVIANSAITMYPNPTNSELFVQGSFSGEINYELFDTRGLLVDKGLINKEAIDISNLTTGVYVIRLKTKSFTVEKKVIKY